MIHTAVRVWIAFAMLVTFVQVARPQAQRPRLKTVIERVGAYIRTFESELTTVVADEQYRQTISTPGGALLETRTLRSDYAMVRTSRPDDWVGFRDTFEVDGRAVRNHDDRLQQLVAAGAFTEAAQVANESARFNLGTEFVVRTVNVPTFALQMLRPENRDRFSFRKAGEDTIAGVRTWWIHYRERERPTIVRTPDGRDQPASGGIWVDPATGEVWKTMVQWDQTASRPGGLITVTYARVPGIGVPVPVAMLERYQPPGARIEGTATYSNYRQFHTGARVIVR